ncbi:MAG: AAA family ATPase [Cyanobacteria bacterium J06641_5]
MEAHLLPPAVRLLLQAETYPHPVSEPVELIQTHISYVLLAGEFAYKIKKAVDFGFLDYSTLELRRHFCYEELRLNREVAPELYLDVVPIVLEKGSLTLGGTGEAVEYAVKMRRFPQSCLLGALFAQAGLPLDLIVTLGHLVADFHAKAATSDAIAKFGEIARVRAAFEDNYRQSQPYIGTLQTLQQYKETQAFTDLFFDERANLLRQRQQNGFVRECHGDLHLGNICYWRDRLYLFDRIEFNEAFRYVDVMYDVAFTVMDLQARERPDLANIFLNTYLEASGDWAGAAVLPLYLCRQAYVRAKVNSLSWDSPTLSQPEREAAATAARRYYRLAWEYAQHSQATGQLFVMSGFSGSGKTTVARELARQRGAIHIRSDAIRKHLGTVPLDAPGGSDLYTPEMTERTYEQLLSLGFDLARQGFSAILDAKFERRSWREAAVEGARARGLPVRIFYCSAPLPVLQARLAQRTGDISDATPELLAQQLAVAEGFGEIDKPFVTTIATDRDWRKQLSALRLQ